MIEPISDAQSRALVRQKEPLFPFQGSAVAQDVMARTDPVLTILSGSHDEREYDAMERAAGASVGAAILQRRTGVLEAGSRIIPAPRQTPSAQRLHRYAVAALKSVRNFAAVREELIYAVFRGWHPAMIQWEQRVIDGELLTVPVKVTPLDPWHFALTKKGHLHQVQGEGSPQTFDTARDTYRFMVARSGNPGKPYGSAALRTVWIPYHLMQRFRAGSWQQLNRSLGVPKATRTGDAAVRAGDLDHGKVRADINQILSFLNHQNILVELGGWTLEMLTVPDAARNTVDLLNFWDTQIRLTLLGQNLTSEVTGGSFAAAKSHMDVRADVVRSDARKEEGWINDELLARGFAINFGEVDADDLPKWRNRLTLPRPDPEKAKMFVDLGGELDSATLADQWELTTPDDAPATLRRPSAPAAPFPGAPAAAGDTGRAGKIRAAGEDEEEVPAVTLGAYYKRLQDRHLEQNADPKKKLNSQPG